MNKRTAPRFPVTLDVTARFSGRESQRCRVRDYCSGGIYLLCDRSAGAAAQASRGEALTVEFKDPLTPQAPAHRIAGRVVRFESHGMGIAFSEENPAAIIALSQLAASQAAGGSGVAGTAVAGETYGHETVEKLSGLIRERSIVRVKAILHYFFEQARTRLMDAAAKAASNVRQSAYFGAMNELRQAEGALSSTFLERLGEQFDLLTTPGFHNRYQQDSTGQSGLSLVESDELDNWLAVRAMAARLEDRLGETLEALESRLHELSANPITLENNPAGPFVLASIFREMLERLPLEEAPRKELFALMAEVLGGRLKPLYDELNELLIAHGVLPTIRKKMEVIRRPNGDIYRRSSLDDGSSEAPPPPETSDSGKRAAAFNPGPTPQGAVSDSPPPGSFSEVETAPPSALSPAQVTPFSYQRPPGRSATSSPAPPSEHAVQALMRLQQPTAEEQAAPTAGHYSSAEVVQALGEIDSRLSDLAQTEDAITHVNQLAQTLQQAGATQGVTLSDSDREAVTYVGGLFSSIYRDQLLPEQARLWFRRLEVPLLKAGILDPSLMEDAGHPARELLNRLEAIGELLQGDDSAEARQARDRIAALLSEIEGKVEAEPTVFSQALVELEPVQEAVAGSYEENIEKLIRQCEQEREVEQARQAVLDALNRRLARREVPLVVLHLLDSGWKNLLLRTLMRNGAESAAYQTYLNVVDLLSARL
ncbi:MAG: DUF1631 family protein, partial [Pseudomonadota bacterium]